MDDIPKETLQFIMAKTLEVAERKLGLLALPSYAIIGYCEIFCERAEYAKIDLNEMTYKEIAEVIEKSLEMTFKKVFPELLSREN